MKHYAVTRVERQYTSKGEYLGEQTVIDRFERYEDAARALRAGLYLKTIHGSAYPERVPYTIVKAVDLGVEEGDHNVH